jgi:hypothetical protein
VGVIDVFKQLSKTFKTNGYTKNIKEKRRNMFYNSRKWVEDGVESSLDESDIASLDIPSIIRLDSHDSHLHSNFLNSTLRDLNELKVSKKGQFNH